MKMSSLARAFLTCPSSLPFHSSALTLPFSNRRPADRWWDFGADTIVNTNKAIRLTQDQQSEMGWLWSRLPLTSTSWQVEWEFKVSLPSFASCTHLTESLRVPLPALGAGGSGGVDELRLGGGGGASATTGEHSALETDAVEAGDAWRRSIQSRLQRSERQRTDRLTSVGNV